MLENIETFLNKYDLLTKNKSYIVAFSGGADSLCLLDLLKKLQLKYNNIDLIAIHVNHNWRDEEALNEMKNCENYCKSNNIKFLSTTLDKNLKHTELVAREARHVFFKECAEKFDNPVIFTGHTLTDNAETVIYRIVKGTGVYGLKGILPKQEINGLKFYRPLLEFSRSDTLKYCIDNNLNYNSDSSNNNTDYMRNFIRLEIMPKLEKINKNAQKAINQLSNLAQSESNITEEYMEIVEKKVCYQNKFITKKFLELSFDTQLKFIYNEFLKHKIDYDYSTIENTLNFIKNNCELKSGTRCSITKDLWLFVNSREFYFINELKKTIISTPIVIDKEGKYSVENKTFCIEKYDKKVEKYPLESDMIAYVDLSNFKNFEFTLRTRNDGDIISPFGMTGSMKLKKYLNSKGIAQHKKDSVILFCHNDEVLWVVGVGLNNKIKVVKKPTHVLKLN